MRSFFIISSALAALVTAAPVKVAEDSALVRRDSGTCEYQYRPEVSPFIDGMMDWHITIDSNQDDGLCQGIWDNVQPHCGVYDKTCAKIGTLKYISFATTVFCGDNRIRDAIWLATEPHVGGVGCNEIHWK